MKRILSLMLAVVLCLGVLFSAVSCGGGDNTTPEALVIMTDSLDGLFNPFFSTSANDGTIVGMTQIGMLSSNYVNGKTEVAFGDDEAVVTKDFFIDNSVAGETTYNFVIKNGIKFSDGHPLTLEDVLFNLYVYLDPVYTGSSTIYSTDIKGLADYRTQQLGSTDDTMDEQMSQLATERANDRINELISVFMNLGTISSGSVTYNVSYNEMVEAIANHTLSSGYLAAVTTTDKYDTITNDNLKEDYDYALSKFKDELNRDYEASKGVYIDEPYKGHPEFEDEVFCFMFYEGYVAVEYERDPVTNKFDRSKIKTLTKNYTASSKEQAIEYVYQDKISRELHYVLQGWATAQELRSEYTSKAKEVILHEQLASEGGELLIDHIEGVKSLGHNTDMTSITINGTEYKIAREHNADGTPKNADEYDVLQITINGVDPKAQWNFTFTVSPQHYYGEGAKTGVDIANHKFGVDYGSFDFMKNVVQSPRNIKLPMGAGAYKATDRANSDNPSESAFYSDNVVYFKSNPNFDTVGGDKIYAPKIEKLRYQIISATNAIPALEAGTVHYITPQLTDENFSAIEGLASKGVKYLLTDQLGYGYIGVNAGKVKDINLRRAIMCAMNTTLAISYYRPGTASQIYWPMSKVSWAYPLGADGEPSVDNEKDYPQMNGTFSEEIARANIQKYMDEAGVSAGDPSLKYTFTIAGSNLQDHPTYLTFRDAAALLNDMGWEITVEPDTQALTKINTGALDVWAAAWGSSLDPDMYQVYHKNSTATSTNAWGYPSIKTSGSQEEKDILDDLSDLIDDAREILDEDERAAIYKDAMLLVLDLAVELPVYQRSVLYVYNSKVLSSDSIPEEVNPFSSPLDRIWELEFAN
ncbi:MAG: hypothetical protein IJY24_07240 [Clostridia bacterium]|nr:hypothetical protein [Clostridia bacterium]